MANEKLIDTTGLKYYHENKILSGFTLDSGKSVVIKWSGTSISPTPGQYYTNNGSFCVIDGATSNPTNKASYISVAGLTVVQDSSSAATKYTGYRNGTITYQVDGTHSYTLTLPQATGTLALTSDIPTSVVTSATLNGSSTTSPSWYAPTSAISTTTNKRYLLGSSSTTSVATTNTNSSCYMQSGYLYSNSTKVDMTAKQDKLVSGTNIKTVNGNSLLGSGDISISGTKFYLHRLTFTVTGSAKTCYASMISTGSGAITSSGTIYNSGYHRRMFDCFIVNSSGNYYPAKFDSMTSNTTIRVFVSGQNGYWSLTVTALSDTVISI